MTLYGKELIWMASEGAIQSLILEYLQFEENKGNLLYNRTNNIPVRKADGNFRRMPKGTKIGRPDIEILIKGFYIGIEVKKDDKYVKDGKVNKKGDWKAKQSDGQIKYERMVKKNHGRYYVVRSYEEVMDIIKEFNRWYETVKEYLENK